MQKSKHYDRLCVKKKKRAVYCTLSMLILLGICLIFPRISRAKNSFSLSFKMSSEKTLTSLEWLTTEATLHILLEQNPHRLYKHIAHRLHQQTTLPPASQKLRAVAAQCSRNKKKCSLPTQRTIEFRYQGKRWKLPWPLDIRNGAFIGSLLRQHPNATWTMLAFLLRQSQGPKTLYMEQLIRSLASYVNRHPTKESVSEAGYTIWSGLHLSQCNSLTSKGYCKQNSTITAFYYYIEHIFPIVYKYGPTSLKVLLQRKLFLSKAPFALAARLAEPDSQKVRESLGCSWIDKQDVCITVHLLRDFIENTSYPLHQHPRLSIQYRRRRVLRDIFRNVYLPKIKERSRTINYLSKIFTKETFRYLIDEVDPTIRTDAELHSERISDTISYRIMLLRILQHHTITTKELREFGFGRLLAMVPQARRNSSLVKHLAMSIKSVFDINRANWRYALYQILIHEPRAAVANRWLKSYMDALLSLKALPQRNRWKYQWEQSNRQSSKQMRTWQGIVLLASSMLTLQDDLTQRLTPQEQSQLIFNVLRYACTGGSCMGSEFSPSIAHHARRILSHLGQWPRLDVNQSKRRKAEIKRRFYLYKGIIQGLPKITPKQLHRVAHWIQQTMPRWAFYARERLQQEEHLKKGLLLPLRAQLDAYRNRLFHSSNPKQAWYVVEHYLRILHSTVALEGCNTYGVLSEWLRDFSKLKEGGKKSNAQIQMRSTNRHYTHSIAKAWADFDIQKSRHCTGISLKRNKQIDERLKSKAPEKRISYQRAFVRTLMKRHFLGGVKSTKSKMIQRLQNELIPRLPEGTVERSLLLRWARLLLSHGISCHILPAPGQQTTQISMLQHHMWLQELHQCQQRERLFLNQVKHQARRARFARLRLKQLLSKTFEVLSELPHAQLHKVQLRAFIENHLREVKSQPFPSSMRRPGYTDWTPDEKRNLRHKAWKKANKDWLILERGLVGFITQAQREWPTIAQQEALRILHLVWSQVGLTLRLFRESQIGSGKVSQERAYARRTPKVLNASITRELDYFRELLQKRKKLLLQASQTGRTSLLNKAQDDRLRRSLQAELNQAYLELGTLKDEASILGYKDKINELRLYIARSLQEIAQAEITIHQKRKSIKQKQVSIAKLQHEIGQNNGRIATLSTEIQALRTQMVQKRISAAQGRRRLLQKQKAFANEVVKLQGDKIEKVRELWLAKLEQRKLASAALVQEIRSLKAAIKGIQELSDRVSQWAIKQIEETKRKKAEAEAEARRRRRRGFLKKVIGIAFRAIGTAVGALYGQPQLGFQIGGIVGDFLAKGLVDKDWKGGLKIALARSASLAVQQYAMPGIEKALGNVKNPILRQGLNNALKSINLEEKLASLPTALIEGNFDQWCKDSLKDITQNVPQIALNMGTQYAIGALSDRSPALGKFIQNHRKILATQVSMAFKGDWKGLQREGLKWAGKYAIGAALSSSWRQTLQGSHVWKAVQLGSKHKLFPTPKEIAKNGLKAFETHLKQRAKEFKEQAKIKVRGYLKKRLGDFKQELVTQLKGEFKGREKEILRALRRGRWTQLKHAFKGATKDAFSVIKGVAVQHIHRELRQIKQIHRELPNLLKKAAQTEYKELKRAIRQQLQEALKQQVSLNARHSFASLKKALNQFKYRISEVLDTRFNHVSSTLRKKLVTQFIQQQTLQIALTKARFKRLVQGKWRNHKKYVDLLLMDVNSAKKLIAVKLQKRAFRLKRATKQMQYRKYHNLIRTYARIIKTKSWSQISGEVKSKLASIYKMKLTNPILQSRAMRIRMRIDPAMMRRLVDRHVKRFEKRIQEETQKVQAAASGGFDSLLAALHRFRSQMNDIKQNEVRRINTILDHKESVLAHAKLQEHIVKLQGNIRGIKNQQDLRRYKMDYLKTMAKINDNELQLSLLMIEEGVGRYQDRITKLRYQSAQKATQQILLAIQQAQLDVDIARIQTGNKETRAKIMASRTKMKVLQQKIHVKRVHQNKRRIAQKEIQIARIEASLRRLQFQDDLQRTIIQTRLFGSQWSLQRLEAMISRSLHTLVRDIKSMEKALTIIGQPPKISCLQSMTNQSITQYRLTLRGCFNKYWSMWEKSRRPIECRLIQLPEERSNELRHAFPNNSLTLLKQQGRLSLVYPEKLIGTLIAIVEWKLFLYTSTKDKSQKSFAVHKVNRGQQSRRHKLSITLNPTRSIHCDDIHQGNIKDFDGNHFFFEAPYGVWFFQAMDKIDQLHFTKVALRIKFIRRAMP